MGRIAVVLAFLTISTSAAWAAPHGVRLTYAGDPTSTIAVSWTSSDAGSTEIIYGTDMANLDQSLTAQQAFVQPAPLSNSFTATLTGLAPNTTYFYRVGKAGDYRPSAASDPYQFTTRSSDACAPSTFILIGDNRADTDGVGASPLWPDILAEAMAHEPDFFVNTGDMVKNGEDPVEWVGFIDASESGWALVPSILTIGNHDDMDDNGPGAYYSQLFGLPTNSQNTWENYYSIDIGSVHFVSLDSNLRGTELADMVAWLSADLAATTQPFKIVFFHHAIYSRGNHYTGEEDSGLLNKTLIPVFDAHDVDFVFNGHSHNYERYAPQVGVDPDWDPNATPRAWPAGNGAAFAPGVAVPDGATGTTYMVSGGAGALTTEIAGIECIDAGCTLCLGLFPLGDCEGEVWARDKETTAFYDGAHNYAVFSVADGVVEVEVWSTDAGNVSSAARIDWFTMTSPEAVAGCATAGDPDAGPGGGTPDAGPGPGSIDAAPGGSAGGDDAGGCGCRSSGSGGGAVLLALVALVAVRRRRPA